MACEAKQYLTRDAMHHSTAAHEVAACARQWLPRLAQQLHSIVQLQHVACDAMHYPTRDAMVASLDGCPQVAACAWQWLPRLELDRCTR